jgi:hypothetical protein
MGREPIGTGRFPPAGGREATISSKHRGRSPDPSKTHPGHGAMVTVLAGGNSVTVTKDSGDSGGGQPSIPVRCLRRQPREHRGGGPAPSTADPVPRGCSAVAAAPRARAADAPGRRPAAP